MTSRNLAFLSRLVLVTLLLGLAGKSVEATSILIVNADGPGEGLNDPTPVDLWPGNPGATLGEARHRAVEFATSLWANSLESDVLILVNVQFDPLGGSATSAILGFGGPTNIFRDFVGAPLTGTWYPSALASKLAGVDMDGGTAAELDLIFNSDVDTLSVLGSSRFYYGLDGAPANGDVDIVSVALHELTHGLGFTTFIDLFSGAKLFGYDDAASYHLEHHGATPADFPSMSDADRLAALAAGSDLHWAGPSVAAASGQLLAGATPEGHVEMYNPDPPEAGSSLSHFSPVLIPDNFMEPSYTGFTQDFELVLALLTDVGWGIAPACEAGVLP